MPGALAKAGVFFDGAVNEAVMEGWVQLDQYDGVDWYLGRESTHNEVLNAKEISILRKYLDGGGRLIISGSELGYALDHKRQNRSFYQNYLKAHFLGDDSKDQRISGRGPFRSWEGVAEFAQSADYIRAGADAEVALRYSNGKTAAIAYRGDYALVNFAFPFEAIGDFELQSDLMKRAVAFLTEATPKDQVQLVKLPKVFGDRLILDLEQTPEGPILFELHQLGGRRVLRQSWKHDGRGQKQVSTGSIPPALYHYRFELMGVEQTGLILKE